MTCTHCTQLPTTDDVYLVSIVSGSVRDKWKLELAVPQSIYYRTFYTQVCHHHNFILCKSTSINVLCTQVHIYHMFILQVSLFSVLLCTRVYIHDIFVLLPSTFL